MPRRSAASLAIVTPVRQDRPEPPDSLCEFAADEWRRVVAARPADWFGRENLVHLKSYCEHLAAAELIGHEIEALSRPINVSMRSKLLRDRRDEMKMAIAKAKPGSPIQPPLTYRAPRVICPRPQSASWASRTTTGRHGRHLADNRRDLKEMHCATRWQPRIGCAILSGLRLSLTQGPSACRY